MRGFRGFVWKEVLHILRDRRTMVILFGMPLAQLILFGFAIRNEIQGISIGFNDPSSDVVTNEIKARLLSSSYFEGGYELTDRAAVQEAFRNGKIKQALLFQPGFAEALEREGLADIQIIGDATDPNASNLMLAYASAILNDYQKELSDAHGGSLVVPEVRMRFNPELRSVFLFVPGLIALILMIVCALMTSITITREKELGTMEVLLVSPLRPILIIVGKVTPYVLLSLINVVTVLTVARYVFGVPIEGNLALLLSECLLFIVCTLSLGILISTRANSQLTATMISLAGLLLPTVILSGFIFPISSMPAILQWISHIVPAKWFLIIIRGIMLKGVGFGTFWMETIILVAMTIVLIAASVKNFKIRLE